VSHQIYDELDEREKKREEKHTVNPGCNTDSNKIGERIRENAFN
jgi:phosphoribosyl-ATP pyrophosphohydrolase